MMEKNEAVAPGDELVERLRAYARQASIVLMRFSGGGSEMFQRIGDEFYAIPDQCEARFQAREAMREQLRERRAALQAKDHSNG